MQTWHEVLRNLQLVTYAALAASAIVLWRRRPDATHAWIAVTFGILGAVLVLARFLPRDSDALWATWTTKFLVVGLVLFPYSLYRFMATVQRPYKWLFNSAAVVAAVLSLWILAMPDLPHPDEPRTIPLLAWTILFVFEWISLTIVVAVRLWRGGRGQPNVAKRRMQTLSLGAMGLAIAVVVGVIGRPRTDLATGTQMFTQILGLISAPLFLAGFSPPGIVTALWRRKEQNALQEATHGLIRALTREEVAQAILPPVSDLFGGKGACLLDEHGAVIDSCGLADHELPAIVAGRANWGSASGPVVEKELIRVPVEKGWLVIVSSAFGPFFGDEEAKLLNALGAFVAMTFERVDMMHRERKNLETMREFVAIAAHDLRTPVTVITGFAELLASEWSDLPEIEKLQMVDTIKRQSGHLARLTEDLLLLSWMEAEGVDARPTRILVKSAIEGIVENLASEYSTRAEIKVDPDLSVHVDPDHFERIMTNYLTNAYVYGQAPYSVEAVDEGEGVRIVVKDEGSGVPVEFANSLFGKFARANKKMSKATNGTGLGLSIVKGLAQAAGGHAWYQPNFPKGAAFAVELPRDAA